MKMGHPPAHIQTTLKLSDCGIKRKPSSSPVRWESLSSFEVESGLLEEFKVGRALHRRYCVFFAEVTHPKSRGSTLMNHAEAPYLIEPPCLKPHPKQNHSSSTEQEQLSSPHELCQRNKHPRCFTDAWLLQQGHFSPPPASQFLDLPQSLSNDDVSPKPTLTTRTWYPPLLFFFLNYTNSFSRTEAT